MAKYRPIQIRIWKDPSFQNYKPNMKLIFIYLCTNESTTESGIYAISTKTINQETGIPEPTVKKLLSNGFKNIAYDFKNSCVFVKNFLKYSVGGRDDLIKKSIQNNYKEFDTPLWNEFIEKYPEKSKGLERIDKPLSKGSIEIEIENNLSNSLSNSNRNRKELPNYSHAKLTEEQYQKLVDKFGEKLALDWIEKLHLYIGSKGKKYRDHYLTILNWDRMEKKKKPKINIDDINLED